MWRRVVLPARGGARRRWGWRSWRLAAGGAAAARQRGATRNSHSAASFHLNHRATWACLRTSQYVCEHKYGPQAVKRPYRWVCAQGLCSVWRFPHGSPAGLWFATALGNDDPERTARSNWCVDAAAWPAGVVQAPLGQEIGAIRVGEMVKSKIHGFLICCFIGMWENYLRNHHT